MTGQTAGDGEERSSVDVDEFRSGLLKRFGKGSDRLRLANSLIELYREKGLLPHRRDQALKDCCRHANGCWRDTSPPKAPGDAGISLPWIGEQYFNSGIAVLGMNFNNYGGLGGHYWVCDDHIDSMRSGSRGKDGRSFARNAMLYLRVVADHLGGGEPRQNPAEATNVDLADYWEWCAFLQTIKCSPGTPRSAPTPAMVDACPTFLAREELRLLEPRVVLLFGRSSLRDVVRPWAVTEGGYGSEGGPSLERNQAEIDGHQFELFSLNHPSSRQPNLEASLRQLAGSLRRNPLPTSDHGVRR